MSIRDTCNDLSNFGFGLIVGAAANPKLPVRLPTFGVGNCFGLDSTFHTKFLTFIVFFFCCSRTTLKNEGVCDDIALWA